MIRSWGWPTTFSQRPGRKSSVCLLAVHVGLTNPTPQIWKAVIHSPQHCWDVCYRWGNYECSQMSSLVWVHIWWSRGLDRWISVHKVGVVHWGRSWFIIRWVLHYEDLGSWGECCAMRYILVHELWVRCYEVMLFGLCIDLAHPHPAEAGVWTLRRLNAYLSISVLNEGSKLETYGCTWGEDRNCWFLGETETMKS